MEATIYLSESCNSQKMQKHLISVDHLVVKRSIAKEKTESGFGADVAGGVVVGGLLLLLLQVVGDKHVQGEHQAKGLN